MHLQLARRSENGMGSATLSTAHVGFQLGAAAPERRGGNRVRMCEVFHDETSPFHVESHVGQEGVKTVESTGQLSSWEETRVKEIFPTLNEETDAAWSTRRPTSWRVELTHGGEHRVFQRWYFLSREKQFRRVLLPAEACQCRTKWPSSLPQPQHSRGA